MSDVHCRLCASDEGVFLDIFAEGNKTFTDKLEKCLSLKVEKSDSLSTNLCHKCAFELNQCNKFMQKYKQARHTLAWSKPTQQKNRCSLCAQTNKTTQLFQLANDEQSIDKSARKIYECFEQDPPKIHVRNLLICLPCRYNLDILSDLKALSVKSVEKLKRISSNKLSLSDLSKTSTFVVSRKTTSIIRDKIDVIEVSDTEAGSSSMKPISRRTQSKRAKNGGIIKTKANKPNRMCGQCHNTIKSGVDMYRFHSTGVTVCKFCWSTMDPSKTSPYKKKAQGSPAKKKTKLCSVFLKDVMGDASLRDNRGYKIEKDEEGNTTFILMDDSSEEDNSTVKIKKEVKESVPRPLKMRGRRSRSDIDDSSVKSKPDKKLKSDGESSKQTFNPRARRSLRQKIKIEEVDGISSDTIVSKKRSAPKVQSQPEKKKKTTKKTSFSDDDVQIITSRVTRTSLRARKSDVSQSELSALVSGSSSGECSSPHRKRKRPVDEIPMTELFEKNVADVVKLNTRSSSISSKESTSPSDFKSLEKSSKLSTSLKKSSQKKSKFIKKKTIEKLKKDKEEYVCTICNVGYKNKLIGMTHELSHLKQPEVTLCRIRPTSNADKMKVTATTESTTSNVNNDVSLEEQSHDVSSTSDALREKVNRETAESGTDVISLKQNEDSSKDKKVDGEVVAESIDQVSPEEKSAEVELPKEKEVTSEQEKELEKSKDEETTQKNEKKKKLCSVVDSINNENEKVEEINKEALKPTEAECKTGRAESVEVEEEKEISEDALKLSVEAKDSNLDPEQISQAEVIADEDESRHEVKKNLSESLKTTTKVTPTENVKSTTSNDINVVEDVVEVDIQTEVCPTIKEPSSKDGPKGSVETDKKEDVEKGIEEKEKDSETAPTLSNLNDSITKVPESKELTDDKPEENNETKDKEEDKHVEEEEEEEDDDEEIVTSIYVADDEFLQLEDEKEDQQKEQNNKEASEDIHEAKSEENGKFELSDTNVKENSNANEDTNKESVKLEEVLTKMFEEETPVMKSQDDTQTSKLIGQLEEGVPETLENISKEICKESQENEKDGSKSSSIRSSDLHILNEESSEKKKIQEEYIA